MRVMSESTRPRRGGQSHNEQHRPEPVTCPEPTAAGPEPLWREIVGDFLRKRRHERGERLSDVASRAGVSPQYLSEVERGLKEPSSEMLAAISGALGLTLIDLTFSVTETLISTTDAGIRLSSRADFALAA